MQRKILIPTFLNVHFHPSEIKVTTAMDFENVFAIKLTKLSLSQVLKKGNIRKLNTFKSTLSTHGKSH